MKDKVPNEFKSNIVYKFNCPGCKSSYIGKTERNFFKRCEEHASKKDSAVNNHLSYCPEAQFLINMLTMDLDNYDVRKIKITMVTDNTTILDTSHNWSILLFKEALYIKRYKPLLNNGLKASRELQLF